MIFKVEKKSFLFKREIKFNALPAFVVVLYRKTAASLTGAASMLDGVEVASDSPCQQHQRKDSANGNVSQQPRPTEHLESELKMLLQSVSKIDMKVEQRLHCTQCTAIQLD